MPLTVKYDIFTENKFEYPFRVFVSGSSQSGKTYFARELLENNHIFDGKICQIYYYHPDYLSDRPVEWHKSLALPVTYQSGIPSLNDLCKIEKHSCIVIDDLYEECINSQAIDYLFRVLSGKKMLSVIIMSQRYFAQGKFGMNIRNNCNFTTLMRNADGRVNTRVASLLNEQTAIRRAIEDTYANNYYPYIFIDSSPRGQVSSYRCYTSIFGRVQSVYSQRGMKAYIINEQDFLANFELINNNTAERKENGIDKEDKIQFSNIKSKQPQREKTETNYISERFRHRSRALRNKRRLERTLYKC